jgi:hypothetical protein
MKRRSVLKGLGGAATVGTIGGASFFALSGSAAATVSGGLIGSTAISSDDGSVDYVAVWGDAQIDWKGFDTPAQYFSIDIELEVVQDWDGQTRTTKQIHSTVLVDLDNDSWGNHDEDLSGSGTRGTIKSGIGRDSNGDHDPTIDWHIVGTDPDNYALPDDPVPASRLEVDQDGSERSFTLVMRSTYTWYDDSENQIFEKTFSSDVDVDVENIESQATASDGPEGDGAQGAPQQS